MKKIRILFFTVSVILFFIISYAIINSMVSYKYEIEEPPKSKKIDIELAAGYLESQITCLCYFEGYVGINLVFLLSIIFVKKK